MFRRSSRFFGPAMLGLFFGLVISACGNDNPKLMVTGIEPDHGDSQGGSYVRIRGNRFTADGPRAVKVYFGGQQGMVSRFASDSELIVEAPGGKPDEVVDVLIVFDPGGQLKIPKGFRYLEHNTAPPTVDDLNINRTGKDQK